MTFRDNIKIIILLFSLLALCYSVAYAFAAMGGYIKGDCTNGQGAYIYPDSFVYVGQWKNDTLIGKGILIISDGNIFIGHFYKDAKFSVGYIPSSEAEVRAIYERFAPGRALVTSDLISLDIFFRNMQKKYI
jgi:hypothetical protein